MTAAPLRPLLLKSRLSGMAGVLPPCWGLAQVSAALPRAVHLPGELTALRLPQVGTLTSTPVFLLALLTGLNKAPDRQTEGHPRGRDPRLGPWAAPKMLAHPSPVCSPCPEEWKRRPGRTADEWASASCRWGSPARWCLVAGCGRRLPPSPRPPTPPQEWLL